LLLLLANFGKESSPQAISPNTSQETLAEMIGTTRSRVSHHEQISQAGPHQQQRAYRGTQFAVERGFARQAAVKRERERERERLEAVPA
jgi:hypothetical protein